MKTLGDAHSFTFTRSEVTSPSLGIGPSANVEEGLAFGGNVTFTFLVDHKSGSVRPVRLVSSCASDFSCRLGSH